MYSLESARLRPLTTTSIGAGAPRLIVSEIRSPGSKA